MSLQEMPGAIDNANVEGIFVFPCLNREDDK